MTKSKKIWIGILAFLPLLFSAILLIYMFTAFLPTLLELDQYEHGDIPPALFFSRFMPFILLCIFLGILHLGLMIYFIIHAINNQRVKSEERIIWVLVFIFTSSIGFPIYWGIRIWPEEKPESNFVKM